MNEIVHISELIAATPEKVFEAWTVPRLMAEWLFKSNNNLIDIRVQEFYLGGRYSILETTPDKDIIDHYGNYLSIKRNSLLAFSLAVPKHFPGVTTVTLRFTALGRSHCLLDFRQTGVEPKIVEESWQTMFKRLSTLLT